MCTCSVMFCAPRQTYTYSSRTFKQTSLTSLADFGVRSCAEGMKCVAICATGDGLGGGISPVFLLGFLGFPGWVTVAAICIDMSAALDVYCRSAEHACICILLNEVPQTCFSYLWMLLLACKARQQPPALQDICLQLCKKH